MSANLRDIAETVAPRSGWDFSRMKAERDPGPWDYNDVVRRFLRPTSQVLDIGTGGGERFLAMADAFAFGLGLDLDPEMIRTAVNNRPSELSGPMSFAVMAAQPLAVRSGAFDLILNRHAPFAVTEVMRVLRPGGSFITQQIGCHNMQNIFEAFGWASSGAFWEKRRRQQRYETNAVELAAEAFRHAGGTVVTLGTYDVGYYVHDLAPLLFWLQSVPLPEPFTIDRHEPAVRSLIERYQTPRGIASNEHRDLLIVQRSKGPEGNHHTFDLLADGAQDSRGARHAGRRVSHQ